jgi:hypothetical protein
MSQWLSLLKDFFQIVFFVVVGIITILTFLKAKKTLLQPIRTEIFKSQLHEFSKILKMFTGKREMELRDDFAFGKLFIANCCNLLDTYGSLFFDIKIDTQKRLYSIKNCPASIMTKTWVAKHIELRDDYKIDEEKEKNQERPDPRTKAAIWSEFEYGNIWIPKEFIEMKAQFEKIMDSPLIPKDCLSLLEDYLGTINQNVNILGQLLTEKAKELPEKYPSPVSFSKASYLWIHHEYMRRFQLLEEKADKIIKYLRTYFEADTILK